MEIFEQLKAWRVGGGVTSGLGFKGQAQGELDLRTAAARSKRSNLEPLGLKASKTSDFDDCGPRFANVANVSQGKRPLAHRTYPTPLVSRGCFLCVGRNISGSGYEGFMPQR